MTNIIANIVSILTSDATLNAIVPTKNIFVGPTDVVMEKQIDLLYPQINIHLISETVRTVPKNAKDTRIQIDIYSRISELQTETIYERILILLDFISGDKSTSHIFWQRLGGGTSLYESEVRVWHLTQDFVVWSMN